MASSTLTRRLQYELSEINNNPSEHYSAGPADDNDMTKWNATIIGPENSPFAGGIFNLSIRFPENFPFRAPEVRFITKVYHPNINSRGEICLDILKDQWSPALSVSKLLLSINSLLTDPNPDDPLVGDIARLYKNNIKEYEKNAREWTKNYANGDDVVDTKVSPAEERDDWDDISGSDDW